MYESNNNVIVPIHTQYIVVVEGNNKPAFTQISGILLYRTAQEITISWTGTEHAYHVCCSILLV